MMKLCDSPEKWNHVIKQLEFALSVLLGKNRSTFVHGVFSISRHKNILCSCNIGRINGMIIENNTFGNKRMSIEWYD